MIKLNTTLAKSMVSKLSKINATKLLEITSYYHIVIDGNGMVATAYDGNNFVQVTDPEVTSKEALDVIVEAEKFTKLINKTTTETITLQLADGGYLQVTGNGKYLVEIVQDEKYPSIPELEDPITCTIKLEDMKKVANINKGAVSTNLTEGYLNGYMMSSDACITTDAIKVCVSNMEFFEDESILLTKDMVNLICMIQEPTATVEYSDGKLLVHTDTVKIFGGEFDGADEYPVEAAIEMADSEFEFKCTLSKANILAVCDRLSLFTDPFKQSELYLDFLKKGLVISTTTGSNEIVPYIDKGTWGDFSCAINSTYLVDLVSSIQQDNFELQYGREDMIKLVDGDAVQILATNEDDDEA